MKLIIKYADLARKGNTVLLQGNFIKYKNTWITVQHFGLHLLFSHSDFPYVHFSIQEYLAVWLYKFMLIYHRGDTICKSFSIHALETWQHFQKCLHRADQVSF